MCVCVCVCVYVCVQVRIYVRVITGPRTDFKQSGAWRNPRQISTHQFTLHSSLIFDEFLKLSCLQK